MDVRRGLILVVSVLLLTSCNSGSGGNTPNLFSIGGTVAGLDGSGLVMQNNSGDSLAVSANGGFTFATKIADQGNYNVSVANQSANPAQTCTVTHGSVVHTLMVAGDTLGYTGGDSAHVQFWKSDGTAGNTRLSLDINQGGLWPWSLNPISFNGAFYLRPEGFGLPSSVIISKADGTVDGPLSTFFDPTQQCVTSACNAALDYYSIEMFTFNNMLYFLAQTEKNGVGGVRLWKTDGTQPVHVVYVNDATGSCENG